MIATAQKRLGFGPQQAVRVGDQTYAELGQLSYNPAPYTDMDAL
jgi:hypothetical protein